MKNNFYLTEITAGPYGGSCLFNSLAYSVLRLVTKRVPSRAEYVELGDELRRITVRGLNILLQNNVDFRNQLAYTYQNEISRKAKTNTSQDRIRVATRYTRRMAKRSSWGGQLELSVISPILINYFNIQNGIVVFNYDTMELIPNMTYGTDKFHKNNQIHLVLHDVNNHGSHFDVLERNTFGKQIQQGVAGNVRRLKNITNASIINYKNYPSKLCN